MKENGNKPLHPISTTWINAGYQKQKVYNSSLNEKQVRTEANRLRNFLELDKKKMKGQM